MKTSIIIPCYNSASLIERTLKSVIDQDGDIIKEIIVIDDGSTDKSVEIIKKLHIPSLILLQQTNQGPAIARNKGIEIAKGKYLAFLDADDYWLPDFLSETIDFLENHPEAIAVNTGQLHIFPGKQNYITPSFLNNNPQLYSKPIILDNFYEFWANYNHVCTGSVLMRTEIVKKTKGQRIDLRITEDIEFWFYLATFGKWGFIPKVLFVSDGSIITKQMGWQNKNRDRWASAPSVEEWGKRVIKRIPDHLLNSYKKARGRIAIRLVYSMILSNRRKLAKQTVKKYRNDFLDDKLSKALKYASYISISWIIICNLIVIKEKFRKI